MFAYVEDDVIRQIASNLPQNWRNISNFNSLENDLEYLNTLGWQVVEKITPEHDPVTQQLTNWQYKLNNGKVTFEPDIEAVIPPAPEEIAAAEAANLAAQWQWVRQDRDQRMKDFEWRYTRYYRQQRLNVTPTDQIANLDTYMQALADITQQADPFNIVWPTYAGA